MDTAIFGFGDSVNNLINTIEIRTSGRVLGIHPSFSLPPARLAWGYSMGTRSPGVKEPNYGLCLSPSGVPS
jgi:hypothetical protein